MKKITIAALAVMGALALGAACEQKGSSPSERGGTTSAPPSRGPSGGTTSSAPSDTAAGSSASAARSSNDMSGTGGAGDAGMGGDAGSRMR